MSQRCFTRKTSAFSKCLTNHALAVALYFIHYNFIRIHSSLHMTPTMAAGVTDTLHDLDWFLDMVDAAHPEPNSPRHTGGGDEPRAV